MTPNIPGCEALATASAATALTCAAALYAAHATWSVLPDHSPTLRARHATQHAGRAAHDLFLIAAAWAVAFAAALNAAGHSPWSHR
jgi:hypothetical protein